MTDERNEQEVESSREDVPRDGARPEQAAGSPERTPPADRGGGRTTFEGGQEGSDEARALPDEPLRPQD